MGTLRGCRSALPLTLDPSRRNGRRMRPHPSPRVLFPCIAALLLTACEFESRPRNGDESGGARDNTMAPNTAPANDVTGTPNASRPGAESGTRGNAGPTTPAVESVPGCAGSTFAQTPEDPAARGPWPVGARTLTLGRLTAEIWYPARPGSEKGVPPVRYDIRKHLPMSQRDKISDGDNPWQDCDCARDLPLDEAFGPYPVIVFVHGTGAFRTQSLPQMVHWASRGFVVVAADHPGLGLQDMLGRVCGDGRREMDLSRDLTSILTALASSTPGLEPFAGHLDLERIAMAGHSAGGKAIANRGDDARVLIPMAADGVSPGSTLRSTLILGATRDRVVRYQRQRDGFERSPAPKRFLGIAEGGHLTFSALCRLKNSAGETILETAERNDVCGARAAALLFDCPATEPSRATEIVDYATTWVLEEELKCRRRDASWMELPVRFPEIQDALEER